MTPRKIRMIGGATAGVLATFAVALLLVVPNAGATSPTTSPALTPQPPAHPLLSHAEQMPAFLNGTIVNTIYLQGDFVGTINATNSTFGMEPMAGQPAIGVTPNAYPTNPANINPFIAMVPWWGPASAPYAPAYNPAAYGIQLMCAPESIALCYDHPPTIQVPGLGTVPLPGHDHLITTFAGHTDTWWSLIVVLVTNSSVFPDLNGTHGITSLAALQAAELAGQASAELDTNTYLNFEVV